MAYNPFFGTIIFVLSESSNKTLFKSLGGKIIDIKDILKLLFLLFFSWLWTTSRIRFLIKVILDDYDRPNRHIDQSITMLEDQYYSYINICWMGFWKKKLMKIAWS